MSASIRSPRADTLLWTAKILFALLGFSGLVTEIATLGAQNRWNAGNFLSYFTVEANTLATASLLVGGLALTTGRRSPTLDFLRGAVTFYMTTVILIFIVLLSGYSSKDLTAVPWDNTVLHYIMPIVVIVDWLVDRPGTRIGYPRAAWWLIFPLAYLVYSLIRGAIVDWYPYPFMNPATHGYVGVVITAAVIAVILAVIVGVVAFAPRWVAAGVKRTGL